MIKRDFYLNQIIDRMWDGRIKVITGIRRCGKSILLFTLFKEYRPMRFFGWLALILALVSIALFIPIAIEYMRTGLVPRFPTLFVSLFTGLAALQSFFTGIMLDVIADKNRKSYELEVIKFK